MGTGTGSIDLSTLNNLHTNLTQHFWFNSNTGAAYGTGVHMTLSSQAEFIANPTGQNILMNTDGISIRNGTVPLMVLDNDSLDFNVVVDLEQGTYSNVASFGVDSTIGKKDDYHTDISPGSFKLNGGSKNQYVDLFSVSKSENPTTETYLERESVNAKSYTLSKTPERFILVNIIGYYRQDTDEITVEFIPGTEDSFNIGYAIVTYDGNRTVSCRLSDNPGDIIDCTIDAILYYTTKNNIDLGIFTFGTRYSGGDVGNGSATLGRELTATTNHQTVVGRNNKEFDGPFVAGNGQTTTKSNAYAIDWEGNGKFNGNVYANCASDSSGTAYIGEIFGYTGSLKSNLTANVDAYVESNGTITLPGGHTYAVFVYIAMTNSTSGTANRRLQIFNKTANASVITESVFVAGSNWGTLNTMYMWYIEDDVTLCFRGAANRPTTTIPNGWIRAVCIA